MIAADKCRVDGCDRNAASSMIRESLPGPLRLCAAHTEEFRLNSAGWDIVWEQAATGPSSVRAPAATPVGHSGPRPSEAGAAVDSTRQRVRSRLSAWRSRPG
jgi:hypothetical protein